MRFIHAAGAVLFLLATLVQPAAAAHLNTTSDEPGFLQSIGPHEPRSDSLWAAVGVATGILVIGFLLHALQNTERYTWLEPVSRMLDRADRKDEQQG